MAGVNKELQLTGSPSGSKAETFEDGSEMVEENEGSGKTEIQTENLVVKSAAEYNFRRLKHKLYSRDSDLTSSMPFTIYNDLHASNTEFGLNASNNMFPLVDDDESEESEESQAEDLDDSDYSGSENNEVFEEEETTKGVSSATRAALKNMYRDVAHRQVEVAWEMINLDQEHTDFTEDMNHGFQEDMEKEGEEVESSDIESYLSEKTGMSQNQTQIKAEKHKMAQKVMKRNLRSSKMLSFSREVDDEVAGNQSLQAESEAKRSAHSKLRGLKVVKTRTYRAVSIASAASSRRKRGGQLAHRRLKNASPSMQQMRIPAVVETESLPTNTALSRGKRGHESPDENDLTAHEVEGETPSVATAVLQDYLSSKHVNKLLQQPFIKRMTSARTAEEQLSIVSDAEEKYPLADEASLPPKLINLVKSMRKPIDPDEIDIDSVSQAGGYLFPVKGTSSMDSGWITQKLKAVEKTMDSCRHLKQLKAAKPVEKALISLRQLKDGKDGKKRKKKEKESMSRPVSETVGVLKSV